MIEIVIHANCNEVLHMIDYWYITMDNNLVNLNGALNLYGIIYTEEIIYDLVTC